MNVPVSALPRPRAQIRPQIKLLDAEFSTNARIFQASGRGRQLEDGQANRYVR